MSIRSVTTDSLTYATDFDCPFQVIDNVTIDTDPQAPMAPSVTDNDADDVEVSDPTWTPLTGYTGQYGYAGAVMHPSETLSGGLAEHVLNTPGTYVVVEVQRDLDEQDNDDYSDESPIGWAILRLNA